MMPLKIDLYQEITAMSTEMIISCICHFAAVYASSTQVKTTQWHTYLVSNIFIFFPQPFYGLHRLNHYSMLSIHGL